MKRTVMTFALLFFNCSLAMGSGLPGHLDDFCARAEYIVVATCTADHKTVKADVGGGNVAALIEVEKVFKAPKSNPKPTKLKITGITTSASRFYYQKGKRYFVFVFKRGFADRQGCGTAIGKGGKLDEGISGYHVGDLICLEKNTNTLGKLTAQVEFVLSGKYEKELLANVSDTRKSLKIRIESAKSLARYAPRNAIKPIGNLILELAAMKKEFGSLGSIFRLLLRLDPDTAAKVSLESLYQTQSGVLADTAAEALSAPGCKLRNFKEHYPKLIEIANKWKRNPDYAFMVVSSMLGVFSTNNARSEEVCKLLLGELTRDKNQHYDRLFFATVKLQFAETVPAFWDLLKKTPEKHRGNANAAVTRFCTACWKQPKGREHDEKKGRAIVISEFPKMKGRLADVAPVKLESGLLFLTKPNKDGGQTCVLAGWSVDKKSRKISPKAFIILGAQN
jgi:hypothetical protein